MTWLILFEFERGFYEDQTMISVDLDEGLNAGAGGDSIDIVWSWPNYYEGLTMGVRIGRLVLSDKDGPSLP